MSVSEGGGKGSCHRRRNERREKREVKRSEEDGTGGKAKGGRHVQI